MHPHQKVLPIVHTRQNGFTGCPLGASKCGGEKGNSKQSKVKQISFGALHE
jgi:hypothetical protein